MRWFLIFLGLLLELSAPASAFPLHRAAIMSDAPCAGVTVKTDFVAGLYCLNGQRVGNFLAMPGASYSGSVSGTGATARTATTSSGAVVSFANGVPRITDLGLLVEEARTNLALQSQTLDVGTVWFPTASSISPNADTAPDGTATADKLVESATTAQHYVTQGFTKASSSIAYVLSVFAKQVGAARNLAVQFNDGAGNGFSIIVNPVTGAVLSGPNFFGSGFSGGTVTFTPAADGYLRAAVSFASNSAPNFQLVLQTISGTTLSYLGDGASGLLLWGVQLEAGTFATSYIPATGSGVTRAADVPIIAGSLLPSANWMIMAAANTPQGGFPALVSFDDGSTANHLVVYRNGAVGGYALQERAASTTIFDNGAATAGKALVKITASKNATAIRGVADGGAATAIGTWTAITPTEINLGRKADAGTFLNGFLQRLIIQADGSSDAQLQALTQ